MSGTMGRRRKTPRKETPKPDTGFIWTNPPIPETVSGFAFSDANQARIKRNDNLRKALKGHPSRKK